MKDIDFSIFNKLDCERQFQKVNFLPYKNICKLICGALVGFDKGTIQWLNTLREEGNEFFFLSEVTGENEVKTAQKVKLPFICTPCSLAKEQIITNVLCKCNIVNLMHVLKNPLLNKCMNQMKAMYPQISINYALEWVCFAESFIIRLLDELKPKEIYLWNIYYPFHRIIKFVAEKDKIPVKCIEFGCIPGTIAIDNIGQQGEAFPFREKNIFSAYNVSNKMLEETKKRLEHIYMTGENRNEQSMQVSLDTKKNKNSNNKTILFVGCNDLESTFMSSNKKKAASLLFASSRAAYSFVKKKCDINQWSLKYKPHPIEVTRYGKQIYDENYVEGNVNWLIDSVDLVITPFSQCAYIAMIRKVPVILLGFCELWGTGSVYEVTKKSEFEKVVNIALENGVTENMESNFLIHVTRMLGFYLKEIN